MKTIPWLTKYVLTGLAAMLISFGSLAQQGQRLHIKCHLQTEGQHSLIQQFVISDENKQKFINGLTDQSIFTADGRTKQKITAIYECVNLNARFNSRKAIELEKQTPR